MTAPGSGERQSNVAARARVLGKSALWRLSPGLFCRLLTARQQQEFAIGVFSGPSPLRLADHASNPVLTRHHVTDVPAGFVADPFMIRCDDHWMMFFEVLDLRCFKGRIALATSADLRTWQYERVVLEQPFHLAYPQVFAWRDDYYMVPDTPDQGILLYRARRFPWEWELVTRIRDEPLFSDSSLLQDGEALWLFTACREPGEGGEVALRLFRAGHPAGPWYEHPRSPVVTGSRASRPAGRPHYYDGAWYRFAQDCTEVYGEQVRAFRITALDEHTYAEEEVEESPVLTGGGAGWRASGMHHVDAHGLSDDQWVACVDGW